VGAVGCARGGRWRDTGRAGVHRGAVAVGVVGQPPAGAGRTACRDGTGGASGGASRGAGGGSMKRAEKVRALFVRIGEWWSARAPRERRVMALAALVLACAGLFSAWDVVRVERARLDAAVPQLRAELARMEDDAAELMRLRTLELPPAMQAAALADAAVSAATARGLVLEVTPEEGGLAVCESAERAPLVDWLAALHADLRLRPGRLSLGDGVVEATLVWSGEALR